jgi:hypothetical protein
MHLGRVAPEWAVQVLVCVIITAEPSTKLFDIAAPADFQGASCPTHVPQSAA